MARAPQSKSSQARPLSQLVGQYLADTFAKQGFASTKLVTHWPDIVGAEIAKHSEPIKIQWPRSDDPHVQDPGTLVLRVEGPAAIEIQHLSSVILDRVNQFFGWRAIGKIALRQAPLTRRPPKKAATGPDPEITARLHATLDIEDGALRQALARLGGSIKRS
ncbi:MAG TPA: DciA family protein [Xanthobacteraceae bacterium]|jgi:hypothetical protein|nr:DciA family protein [Xanthobacteraceae bacterium]